MFNTSIFLFIPARCDVSLLVLLKDYMATHQNSSLVQSDGPE